MNYYSSYTGNRKRRTVRRVIIVLVSVALIFGATVIFGNHLKKKAEDSGEHNYGGIGREDLGSETESPVIIPPSEGGSGSSESVQGVCVMLGSSEDMGENDGTLAGSAFEERLKTAAKDNTGVLIPLTGEDGFLLYNSDRASAVSRLPANPSLPDMADLRGSVELAKSLGLRVSAFVISGVDIVAAEDEYENAIAADSRIAADAAEAGFDEMIISSLVKSPDEITGEASHVILRYLNQMTAAAEGTAVGLSLPPEIYETATLSPQIELFVSRADFLTMELVREKSTVEHLNYICENLAGTLSVYNMRMLLSPADTEIGDKLTAKLRAVGHSNYLYTSVPETKTQPDTTEPVTADTGSTADKTDVTE